MSAGRPTKSHEYLFLLSKSPSYFYDSEAIAEESVHPAGSNRGGSWSKGTTAEPTGLIGGANHSGDPWVSDGKRNARSVWSIATKPFSGSHFAVFPDSLAERCIKAGSSEKGCCSVCGAPWVRVVERESNWQERKANGADAGSMVNGHNASHGIGMSHDLYGNVQTLGWQPTCPCDAPIVPCVVLDCFGGAGTVSLVAERLGRDSIYIDLSSDYAAMAKKRIYDDAPMFANVDLA